MFVRGDKLTCVCNDQVERVVFFRYYNNDGLAVVEDLKTGKYYTVAERSLKRV